MQNSRLSRFHPLQTDIPKPERFTYPFCYEPHPLAVLAAEEVMAFLESSGDKTSDTSEDHSIIVKEALQGKMFGVLVVEDEIGQLGFLAAFSGLLAGRNDIAYFIPAVYDMLHPDGYFKINERKISLINEQISAIENSQDRKALFIELSDAQNASEKEISEYRKKMDEAKKRRDAMRADMAIHNNSTEEKNKLRNEEDLIQESQFMKAQLRRIKKRHSENIESITLKINALEEDILRLKKERQYRSDELQKWIFAQFRMRNAIGEESDLNEIFRIYADGNTPPAGSGECCAPKLLQYAFLNGLKPVCMAEFWWGKSPVSEIRHHKQYYPSCQGKCKPILSFMLQGLDVDPNPIESQVNGLQLIYEDSDIAVINKPAGMLSVPGKTEEQSVYSIVRRMFPDAEEPMIVHRLDMDTSGLMVIAKTKQAHEHLQIQFAEHSIRKTYTALVEGEKLQAGQIGRIDLPLLPDYLDRPRQKVDISNGKQSVTEFRIMKVKDKIARVELRPLTGRTHQLRVHCAHPDGLGCPIIGDPLYGLNTQHGISENKPARMYLHATTLELTHPITGKRMTFHTEAEF